MDYKDSTDHIIKEIDQMKIILEGFEKQINEKPKLDSYDAETISKIFQAFTNTITNAISVLQEISEEKILQDIKIKELVKSDRLREELLSVVKHEFRTPLVPIKGYCEMLLEQSHENLTNEQQTALSGIFNGIKKFEKIVDNILDLHALETGNITINKEVILVQDFMAGIASDFSKKLTQGTEFINSSNDAAEIQGDVVKLRQVFDCLLDNALSFVPKENGKIEIGVKENEKIVLFYVKNNGPEIPKLEQQNIFKKFYQVDTSPTRNHQGMGLGLSICKEIIKKLGGKIWCESESGKGVIFYFSLPIHKEKIAMESTSL